MVMRTRVRLQQHKQRTEDYYRLRHYWIGELFYLRAKRRNGTGTKSDIKAAQRALVKIRKEH